MPNFPNTFETSKQSIISAFSIYMTVPLNIKLHMHNVIPSLMNRLTLYVRKYLNSTRPFCTDFTCSISKRINARNFKHLPRCKIDAA